MASQLRSELLYLYNPPTCGDGPCQEQFEQFIYIVVVPCAVVLLLCLLLSWIMCCKTSKCRKRKVADSTDDAQLETYNAIRRASAGLRYMSQHRETALMGSRAGSMTLERPQRRPPRNRDSCYSAPGTLQRQHRQRQVEYSQSRDELGPPHTVTDHAPGSWRSNRNRYSDQPSAPPPPAYSSVTDDTLPGADFLMSQKTSSGVRYQSLPLTDDQ